MHNIQLIVAALLIVLLLLLGLYSGAATALMLAFVVHRLAAIERAVRQQQPQLAARSTLSAGGAGGTATHAAPHQR